MNIMLNPQFYRSLLSFTEKSFYLLRNLNTTKPIRRKFKIIGNNSWDWLDETDYVMFVHKNTANILKLPEFKTLELVTRSDDTLSKQYGKLIPYGSGRKMLFYYWTFLHILSDLLNHDPTKVDTGKFDIRYESLEKFLYSSSTPVIHVRPLGGFSSNTEVKINDNLMIRKLADVEKEDWANRYMFWNNPTIVLNIDYAIVNKFKIDKHASEESSRKTESFATKEISNLVTALRLVHGGIFEDYGTIRKIDMNIPDNNLDFRNKGYVSLLPGNYSLSENDLLPLEENYRLLRRTDNNNLIKNAVVWFNLYSTETDRLRKVIYLAIVVETLLSDSPGTVTHKLCCRMANLLENNFDKKNEIYNNINDFYATRSAILHGNENKTFENLEQIDEYIRRMFLKIMKTIEAFDRQASFDTQYKLFLRTQDFGI